MLHWHIVDSQSFPFESKSYPLLSQKGAYSSKEVYTAADVARIVQYGYERGVRIVPEFDGPGHAYIWGVGYPNITACPDFRVGFLLYSSKQNEFFPDGTFFCLKNTTTSLGPLTVCNPLVAS